MPVDSATPQWEFAGIPRTGQVRAAGPIVLQLRDNPAALVSHISDRFMTQHCDLPFCALNAKSHINHGEAGYCPGNHWSCSAVSSGEKLSCSSTGNSRNGSSKILLTASRVRFERSVTVHFVCDEDHILRRIAVHVCVTAGTTAKSSLGATLKIATPGLRCGGSAASPIWLDLQAG